jgi:hypothetical protein
MGRTPPGPKKENRAAQAGPQPAGHARLQRNLQLQSAALGHGGHRFQHFHRAAGGQVGIRFFEFLFHQSRYEPVEPGRPVIGGQFHRDPFGLQPVVGNQLIDRSGAVEQSRLGAAGAELLG